MPIKMFIFLFLDLNRECICIKCKKKFKNSNDLFRFITKAHIYICTQYGDLQAAECLHLHNKKYLELKFIRVSL